MSKQERLYDLTFEAFPDGSVNLEQSAGCGEVAYLTLHASQLRLLAERTGLTGRASSRAPEVADLERRIAVLTSKLQSIVCNKAFRSDLAEGLGEGFEYLAILDGLLDLAFEFDGGRLEPVEPINACPEAAPRKPNEHLPGFELSIQEPRHD